MLHGKLEGRMLGEKQGEVNRCRWYKTCIYTDVKKAAVDRSNW